MSRVAFADETTEWEHLMTTVEVNKTELSFLDSPRSALGPVLERAKEANLRQSTLKAQVQQSTRDLEKAMAEGRELATRLRNGIRTQYGLRGEKLTEFGLQPRRKTKAKKTNPEQNPTPAPTTPTTIKT